MAKEIEITVAKLNDLNMDYSEVVDFKDFRKKFYEDWYNASLLFKYTLIFCCDI